MEKLKSYPLLNILKKNRFINRALIIHFLFKNLFIMKNTFLLLLLSFTFCGLNAQTQITYQDFGDGWVIPVNSNLGVDLDENGTIDFHINQYEDEIGFSPTFAVGCFSSPSEFSYTSFNARELALLEEGDLVQINEINLFDFIDEDRGSAYSLSEGFADGWVNQEDVYLGFVIIISGDTPGVRNGWLRTSVDTSSNALIIKEWAFTELETNYGGGILVGDKGKTTSVKTLDNIAAVTISPNPANASVQLSFDYSGTDNLSVSIQNSVGQAVYSNNTSVLIGNTNLTIPTSEWANGIYFIRFETPTAIRTEMLSIAR